MAPTEAFYKEIDEKEHSLWTQAQLPKDPFCFFVRVHFHGVPHPLYGFVRTSMRLGSGDLELPISHSASRLEYSAVKEMIEVNRLVIGSSDTIADIYKKLGLEIKHAYGEVKTGSLPSSTPLGRFYTRLYFKRDWEAIVFDDWRNRPHGLSERENRDFSVRSAMGFSRVMQRDLPQMTITPLPSNLLKSEQLP